METIFVATVFERKFLQFAVGASYAGKTFLLMVAENKFDSRFSGFEDFGRVGVHFHTLGYHRRAARDETSGAFDFDYANTATAFVGKVFIVAKRGNRKARLTRRVENTRSLGNGNRYIVYL